MSAVACTSTQKSGVSEAGGRSCAPGATDVPIMAVLSSHFLGGNGGGPHRIAYTGGVPPMAVIYSSNHLLFAKNVSKTSSPFFSYYCVKLTDAEKSGLIEGIDEVMPEVFETFDAKDTKPQSGFTQLLTFKSEFECSQYEIKGGLEAAREFGSRSRSSVAIKVPNEILDGIERLAAFSHDQATPWFPDTALVEFRQLTDAEAKAIKSNPVNWPESFKLTRVKDKEMRLQLDGKTKVFTTQISTAKLKEFSTLMRSKILREQKVWVAGYRLMLPSDRFWAGPHPTKGEEYSICNRYIPRSNFWRLYGLNFLTGN
jgi:hypothetical protein